MEVQELANEISIGNELQRQACLYAALAAAQGEFQPIPKNREAIITAREGRASYKFRYADLEIIIAAVRPALSKHGLALVQIIENDVMVTALLHKDGGRLESHVVAPSVQKHSGDLKQYASALAYMRRYMITALLGLAADDDLDSNGEDGDGGSGQRMGADDRPPATQRRTPPQTRATVQEQAAPVDPPADAQNVPEAATSGQIKMLRAKLAAMGKDEAEVLVRWKLNAIEQLTEAQYRTHMEELRK